MFKLEILTRESDFQAFSVLQNYDFEVIGGIPLQTCTGIRGQHASIQSTSQIKPDEYLKVELFTSLRPAEAKALLTNLELPYQIRFQTCSPLELQPIENNTYNDTQELDTSDYPPKKQQQTSSPVICKADRLSPESMRFHAEAQASRFFLASAFTFLHQYKVEIFSGRKFRQGERDFITCTVSPIPEPLLAQLQEQFTSALNADSLQLNTEKLKTQSSFKDSLNISIQAAGSLWALRITCLAQFSFVRPYLSNFLAERGIDISLARLTHKQDYLEDVYHFKPTAKEPLSLELAETLRTELERIQL